MTTQVNTTDADVNVTGDGDVTISANNDVDVTASNVAVSGDANIVGASAAVSVNGENATVTVEAENPTINAVNATVNVLGDGGETILSYKPDDLPTDGSVTKAYVIVPDDTASLGWRGYIATSYGDRDSCALSKVLVEFDDTIRVRHFDTEAQAIVFGYLPSIKLHMYGVTVDDEEEKVQLPTYWLPVHGGLVSLVTTGTHIAPTL